MIAKRCDYQRSPAVWFACDLLSCRRSSNGRKAAYGQKEISSIALAFVGATISLMVLAPGTASAKNVISVAANTAMV